MLYIEERRHYGATRILLKNIALEAKVYDVPALRRAGGAHESG
jgi:hypothetical protein